MVLTYFKYHATKLTSGKKYLLWIPGDFHWLFIYCVALHEFSIAKQSQREVDNVNILTFLRQLRHPVIYFS